jgi:hypothetical protein
LHESSYLSINSSFGQDLSEHISHEIKKDGGYGIPLPYTSTCEEELTIVVINPNTNRPIVQESSNYRHPPGDKTPHPHDSQKKVSVHPIIGLFIIKFKNKTRLTLVHCIMNNFMCRDNTLKDISP